MQDLYEQQDYELSSARYDDEFEMPEAPDSWNLEDFGDVVNELEEFSF